MLGTRAGTPAKGYCARGTGTMGVAPDAYSAFIMGGSQQAGSGDSGGSGVYSQACNATTVPRIRNHPDAGGTPPYPIEQVVVTSTTTNLSMRKGMCRYLGLVPSASINDTADSKQWLVLVANVGTTNTALVIGPMDGATTPVTT